MNARYTHAPGVRFSSVLALCLSLAVVCTASAQDLAEPTVGDQAGKFGVGFASSWPAYGLSGTMRINEKITAEAVIGFLGTISNFGARGWYRFNRNPTYDLYGYAGASLYRYEYTTFVSSTFRTQRATENVLGLGGGVGIEAGIQSLFKDETLPPIFLNWEIGLALANFDYYNFSSFSFGGGVHYRFGN